MESDKSNLDKILGFIGILSLLVIIYHVFRALNSNTETNVITDDAIKAIQDPEKAERLREVVDDYHDTGEWSVKKLESIL